MPRVSEESGKPMDPDIAAQMGFTGKDRSALLLILVQAWQCAEGSWAQARRLVVQAWFS